MFRISIIVAIDRNHAIGAGNKLIYWLPDDLKRFKQLTTGNTVIMGRKTFESLPKGALPNRRNIVLTTNKSLTFSGTDIFPSLKAALDDCRQKAKEGREDSQEIFIIGGASVYRQALPLADRLCLTEIDAESPSADTFFPPFNPDEWTETFRENHQPDERHAHPFAFVNLERINPSDDINA